MAAVLKVYVYKNCDTCRRALKFLEARGIAYETMPIRETPPSKAELRRMLEMVGGRVTKLFNTSGRDYRELGLGARLAEMKEAEALELLQKNGNLVKRPFALSGEAGAVGFHEAEWADKFGG